ncbi:UNVERIFIED_CONTAM: hypothetical protein K2H54_026655 [Gekko kuhli]
MRSGDSRCLGLKSNTAERLPDGLTGEERRGCLCADEMERGEKKKQKKKKPTNDWRPRRNAIRLTNEYTVETLVVADADMVQYHGADTAQRFILTVMNMQDQER